MSRGRCLICGQTASFRVVGHSNILSLCWKHNVEMRRKYGADYHLNPSWIKKEIINEKEKTNKKNAPSQRAHE